MMFAPLSAKHMVSLSQVSARHKNVMSMRGSARIFIVFIIFLCGLCAASRLSAAGRLKDDFAAAIQFDPEFQSAVAQRDAGVEALEQARAGLRPQVSANVQRSINNTDSRSQTSIGPVDRNFENYPALNASLQIRQALFRPKAWAGLDQGRAQAQYADLLLQGAKQDLGLRLLGIHAEWGSAARTLEIASEIVSIHSQLAEVAKRQFSVGDATRVDVEVAASRVAQAQNQVEEAKLVVENSKLGWIQLTGRSAPASDSRRDIPSLAGRSSDRRMPPDETYAPLAWHEQAAERLPLGTGDLSAYQQVAREQSPVIRAQRAAVEAAAAEVRKVSADHYPVADLFAAATRSSSAMDNTVGTQFRSNQVGIQVSIPLYAGGAVESTIRQASASYRRAQSELQAASNRLTLQIDRDWRTLQAARVDAQTQLRLLQAVTVAMDAAIRGQSAGITTTTDVLQAKIQMLHAQRDLVKANARAIVAWARLMATSGSISEQSLEELTERIAK